MTGTGGWAYFSATHYMLGIRPEFDSLTIDPCVPEAWDGFSVTRNWRDVQYEITVENPEHISKGVKKLYLDGKETDSIPVMERGSVHKVTVIMGE